MLEDKSQATVYRVTEKGAKAATLDVIGESRWVLYVNDQEVVSFMATPRNLHHLALGFLASEGLVAGLEDIASLRVNRAPDRAYWFIPALGVDEERAIPNCEAGVGSIQVRLTRAMVSLPSRRIITSGCGGGVTFDEMANVQEPLHSDKTVRPSQIFAMMQDLSRQATLYRESRGVHTSALGDGNGLLSIEEDVGRHNTIDKIRGDCLLRGIPTQDGVLLSTGRISSEMITKAGKMRVPIVVSRTSPTYLAVQLAQAWNIALVGYAHAGEMLVYTGIERIVF
jgi:FdhD protein